MDGVFFDTLRVKETNAYLDEGFPGRPTGKAG